MAPRARVCLIGRAIFVAPLGRQLVFRVVGRRPKLLLWTTKPQAKMIVVPADVRPGGEPDRVAPPQGGKP
eukprot:11225351-Lingulodinium_polyedra.AAC.1